MKEKYNLTYLNKKYNIEIIIYRIDCKHSATPVFPPLKVLLSFA